MSSSSSPTQMIQPPSSKLTDHKFLIFDVYGTLIDWESGIHTALQPLLSRFTSSARWSREDVIRKFAVVETEIQTKNPNMPYSSLLAEVHMALEKELEADSRQANSLSVSASTAHKDASETSITSIIADSSTTNAHTKFAHSIKHWSPFFDSASALHTLAKHFKLIVLSNVDYSSFADSHAYLSEGLVLTPSESCSTTSRHIYTRPTTDSGTLWLPRTTAGSKSPFSLIMTAQDVGAYKPSLDGFETVFKCIMAESELHSNTTLELSGMKGDDAKEYIKDNTLIVAQSLAHDHVPAKKMGVQSVWIDRQDAKMRPDDGEDQEKWGWKWRFTTLGEMASAVEQEFAEGGE